MKNSPDDSIWRIKYAGLHDAAIINDIYKQYLVSANILFGEHRYPLITRLVELVVILSGENQNLTGWVRKCRSFLTQKDGRKYDPVIQTYLPNVYKLGGLASMDGEPLFSIWLFDDRYFSIIGGFLGLVTGLC